MQSNLYPIDILNITAKKILQIVWSDGQTSSITHQQLRESCPCAHCKYARSQGRTTYQSQSINIELTILELVGSYALEMGFSDGHHYGIYPWSYLRDQCPSVIL